MDNKLKRNGLVARGYPFKKINKGLMKCWTRDGCCSGSHKKVFMFDLPEEIVVQKVTKHISQSDYDYGWDDSYIENFYVKTKDGCNFTIYKTQPTNPYNKTNEILTELKRGLSLYEVIKQIKGLIPSRYFDFCDYNHVKPEISGDMYIVKFLMDIKDFRDKILLVYFVLNKDVGDVIMSKKVLVTHLHELMEDVPLFRIYMDYNNLIG